MLRTLLIASALLSATVAHAAPTKEVAEKSADPRDKIICKKFLETGSLVRGYRVCKSKADWEWERDNLRQLNVSSSCRQLAEGGSCQ